ncbi:MAG: PepSY-like domain-containing protein [Isosphaeraceae bacterium]
MTTRSAVGCVTLSVILALSGFRSVAWSQESEVPLNKVPRAVMNAAKAKFPGAKIKEAGKETEEGKTLYELEMTHKGQRMDVSFQPDGTLVVVETRVARKDLPEKVLGAVKAKYPHAKIVLAESVRKGPKVSSKVDFYELHLTAANKKIELEISPAGKILNTEVKKAAKEEDEEDEKD